VIRTGRGKTEGPAERLVKDVGERRALAALSQARLNFDPSRRHEFTAANGWHLDQRREPLPAEPPGPPVPGGSWAIARGLMCGYEFADPSIVRAIYNPEAPLEGRDMLLELRFWGLRFLVGTRVTSEYEETRALDGREAHVWGWSYATLEGHLERGEMAWEVRKWLDTGAVEFTIRAYSQRAEIRNPLVRLGFMLFGRHEQLRFYDMTCQRMRRLTAEALGEGPRGDAVRRAAAELTARPATGTAPAPEELARRIEADGDGE
jgi:uncharacterized protein (UPF0548 family)